MASRKVKEEAVSTARPHVGDRGEISLALGGQDMVLRPSFEAIEGFERATGKGLLQLSREALSGVLTLSETAHVACECIRAWGRANGDHGAAGSNVKRVAELIMEGEGGFHGALETVSAMLALAVTGKYSSKGEIKPAAKMTKEAPAAG